MAKEGEQSVSLDSSGDALEAEYEIVEHEQAHAIAAAKNSREISLLEELEGESRWGLAGPLDHPCEPFLDAFAGMINRVNLESILKEQAHMLSTMEISNEKLASLNHLSEEKYLAMSQEFRGATQTLHTMKKQLDSCFRRIRSLKSKLATQYPLAYEAAIAKCKSDIDEEEER